MTTTTHETRWGAIATLAIAATLALSGCALTSKAAIVQIRHFSPERVRPHLTSEAPGATAATAPDASLDLRLGRVTSGGHLHERIAFRDAAYELGYYEELRWTERPETFVRRALGRALFEEHGLHRVVSGDAPTLEVEVIAFDELRLPAGRAARVQLKLILIADRGVLYEETITIDRPVSSANGRIEDVVAAMADALDAAADRVTAKVRTALASPR